MGECAGESTLRDGRLRERLAYTWSENAHEFRLTPWYDDPVGTSSGEAFYLRDEESGHFWSPTPLPSRGAPPYVSRHGFGYSVLEHTEDGIRSEMWVYVATDASVKADSIKGEKRIGPIPPTLRDRYVEMGTGRFAAKNGDACQHRNRP